MQFHDTPAGFEISEKKAVGMYAKLGEPLICSYGNLKSALPM